MVIHVIRISCWILMIYSVKRVFFQEKCQSCLKKCWHRQKWRRHRNFFYGTQKYNSCTTFWSCLGLQVFSVTILRGGGTMCPPPGSRSPKKPGFNKFGKLTLVKDKFVKSNHSRFQNNQNYFSKPNFMIFMIEND